MKYQFCIRFNNIDANSAASKAVLDCNKIFSEHGYKDYTFTVGDNSNKLSYYLLLLKELVTFLAGVKRNSIVGIQYPLLSINNVFKYFIKIARVKNVRFFCVVHDLESLRTGGKNAGQIKLEIENLNIYDTIIVHNNLMLNWLKKNGVIKDMIPLMLFDYLSTDFPVNHNATADGPIVYAGNLLKSKFIYSLNYIADKQFNVYGPGFQSNEIKNLTWQGEYSPQQIPQELNGSFGLIWDGISIDICDDILGNYLKYNNPHKCSLYIAAGLPIIAPHDSAIGLFIKQHNIGVLIHNLHDLQALEVNEQAYHTMKINVLNMRKKVIGGDYFSSALKTVEKQYAGNS